MVDERSRTRLEKAVTTAIQRASLTLESYAEGRVDDGPSLAPGAPILQKRDLRKPILFEDLVAGWAAENKPAPKTIYEWRQIFKQLTSFLGHDDAMRLTADDLVEWKAKMIASGLHGKTIRDAKIAPIRAVLRWAVDNRRLPANPAERITVDVKAAAGTQKRSFSDCAPSGAIGGKPCPPLGALGVCLFGSTPVRGLSASARGHRSDRRRLVYAPCARSWLAKDRQCGANCPAASSPYRRRFLRLRRKRP